MNRRALVLGTASVAIAVFAGGAALYGSKSPAPAPVTTPASSPSNDTLVRMYSPVMGPVSAPVTIVEFFDPSCEACRAFYPIVKQMMGQTGTSVRLVLRYTPLHKGSDEAVRILEAARKQNRFQPVLEALLAQQPVWAAHGAPDLEKAWQAAASAGLNLDQARKDAVSPSVDAVLAQDIADVRANKVEQTPTFFVNGKPLTEFSPQGLYNLVKDEIDATKPSS
ncbi:disulfide bond formation protein DsbA [Rhizobium sp. Root149]|uniref:DsbA family protein n=1 Tax=Rhizobium sp. Root149 TaxID=1736473 RepID=UPI000713C9F0|nr:thioredoxin domain-containing protein [Rhizobium sp. Root149]KQZ59771.1 disulfide bond formation protein DsbA [Rhizobium sp. Root149]